MKKTLLMMALVISTTTLFAQETESTFNKWSVELGGGLHKISRPFAPTYYTASPDTYQLNLGVRHMLNEKFGLRASFGYNDIKNADNSAAFESKYYRATLEGVVNLGNVLKFQDWTKTFGLLVHGGAGYSALDIRPDQDGDLDEMLNVMVGLTPQIKLSRRLSFFVDASLVGNVRSYTTWDGTQEIENSNRGVDGSLYNFSAGFNIYLGKNKEHADWYVAENKLLSEIEELEARLAKVETDLIDTDQDGVADYLDRENNTMSGVAVDSKGVAVDKNENGIPDEIESSLDKRFLNRSEYNPNAGGTVTTINGGTAIKDLLDKGYVNVYFKFNSTTPQTYSLEAINYLKVYMNENPSASAQLVGYADEIGNSSANNTLSAKRAKKVYDILVASGISPNRLSHTGNGEDASVDKNSAEARQLVRRVTFKLN